VVDNQAQAKRPAKRPGKSRKQKQKHLPDAGNALAGRPADIPEDGNHQDVGESVIMHSKLKKTLVIFKQSGYHA
jgi:hypothetical protein